MCHGNDAVKRQSKQCSAELLVGKERVVIKIYHGAGVSQIGAKPFLILLTGSSQKRETRCCQTQLVMGCQDKGTDCPRP